MARIALPRQIDERCSQVALPPNAGAKLVREFDPYSTVATIDRQRNMARLGARVQHRSQASRKRTPRRGLRRFRGRAVDPQIVAEGAEQRERHRPIMAMLDASRVPHRAERPAVGPPLVADFPPENN